MTSDSALCATCNCTMCVCVQARQTHVWLDVVYQVVYRHFTIV